MDWVVTCVGVIAGSLCALCGMWFGCRINEEDENTKKSEYDPYGTKKCLGCGDDGPQRFSGGWKFAHCMRCGHVTKHRE